MKAVEIRIDMQTGESEVEAHGYTDGGCRTATEAFEKALGQVKDRKMKPQVKAKQGVKAS